MITPSESRPKHQMEFNKIVSFVQLLFHAQASPCMTQYTSSSTRRGVVAAATKKSAAKKAAEPSEPKKVPLPQVRGYRELIVKHGRHDFWAGGWRWSVFKVL